jgi:hypothetical protein
MDSDFLEIVTNKEKIQKELIFYSLFLMVFENFVSFWKEQSISFYANDFSWDEERKKLICKFSKKKMKNGKTIFVPDEKAREKCTKKIFQTIKSKNGNWNPKLSLFHWMVGFGLIEKEDYSILEKCYRLRNVYGHEIASCIERYVTKEEKQSLKMLIEIAKKASRNWILMVEIPANPDYKYSDFLDDKGNYKEPEVYSGFDLFYSFVLMNLKEILDE